MGILSFVQTIWTANMPILSQVSRLAVPGGDTLRLLVHDPATETRAEWNLSPAILSPDGAQVENTGRSSTQVNITVDGITHGLDKTTIQHLIGSETSAHAYLDESGFVGDLMVLHQQTAFGKSYLFAARSTGSGIGIYELNEDDVPTLISTRGDSRSTYLKGVTDMAGVTLGGKPFVVAISAFDNGVSLLELRSNGQLQARDSFGIDELLPVDRPSALEVVELGGQTFALITSFGSSSLTVIELLAAGEMRFIDQAIDTLETRFAGASALDTITLDGQVFVAVAGNDGGVSLFQLLPNGRLVLLDTQIDGILTALDGVRQLQFAQVGDQIELFALSAGDAGLTRLHLDLGPIGVTATRSTGTDGRDILTAPEGDGQVQAGAGDDILIDGGGRDSLRGGSGADLFVLRPDEQGDIIRDFNVTEDRIDLSSFTALSGLSDISVSTSATGAVLRWDKEVLTVHSHNGARLSAADLEERLLFNDSHVVIPERLPQIGSPESDTFIWTEGEDSIDGAGGVDTMTYAAATQSVTVDLLDSSKNTGDAAGDELSNIESLVGSHYGDSLSGDDNGNTLNGGPGNDLLRGRGGNDWIIPGEGQDTINGGSGRDMVSFVDLPDRPGRTNVQYLLELDLAAGTASTSPENTYELVNIERVTGTIFADRMKGSDGDDQLRGLGDYDWFTATSGQDTLDGGTGKDMVSYVEWMGSGAAIVGSVFGSGAPPGSSSVAGVVVDLDNTNNNTRLAAGHTYISIERITGSSWQDVFFGDGESNDFRGLGGYDWFVGSTGGRERYFGGAGIDTVTYYRSSAGISASLSNGATVKGAETGRGITGDAARDLYFEIENLIGSHFDDRLGGNSGRNQLSGLDGDDFLFGYGGIDQLKGGAGNDTIDGGDGSDYALFNGDYADYTLTRTSATTVTATGPDGTDSLIDVEYFRFNDQDVRIWDLSL